MKGCITELGWDEIAKMNLSAPQPSEEQLRFIKAQDWLRYQIQLERDRPPSLEVEERLRVLHAQDDALYRSYRDYMLHSVGEPVIATLEQK